MAFPADSFFLLTEESKRNNKKKKYTSNTDIFPDLPNFLNFYVIVL